VPSEVKGLVGRHGLLLRGVPPPGGHRAQASRVRAMLPGPRLGSAGARMRASTDSGRDTRPMDCALAGSRDRLTIGCSPKGIIFHHFIVYTTIMAKKISAPTAAYRAPAPGWRGVPGRPPLPLPATPGLLPAPDARRETRGSATSSLPP